MTYRLGEQFGGIFASGVGTEPGNTLRRHYVPGFGRLRDEMPHPAPLSATASLLEQKVARVITKRRSTERHVRFMQPQL